MKYRITLTLLTAALLPVFALPLLAECGMPSLLDGNPCTTRQNASPSCDPKPAEPKCLGFRDSVRCLNTTGNSEIVVKAYTVVCDRRDPKEISCCVKEVLQDCIKETKVVCSTITKEECQISVGGEVTVGGKRIGGGVGGSAAYTEIVYMCDETYNGTPTSSGDREWSKFCP